MKYTPERIENIEKCLKKGASIMSTCRAVGISKDTFYEWMKTKPDFSDRVEKAMNVPNKKVENALYRKAAGLIRIKEEYYEQIKDGKNRSSAKLVKTVYKKFAPDLGAIVFYLVNKLPEEYKDIKFNKVEGGLDVSLKAGDVWKVLKKAMEEIRKNAGASEK
jgi:transposase-like protein